MELSGKHALVTGGTSGIGLELARLLRDQGARVCVVGRRDETVSDVTNREGFVGIAADLARSEGCDVVIDAFADAPVDLLVNSAGVDPRYRVGEGVDTDEVERAIFLNLTAPVRLVTGLIEGMKARPKAAIVNVTSGYAIAPSASTPVYCATKAGLRSYTLALRHQLRSTAVSVIEALPPLVDTPMTSAVVATSKMSPRVCANAILQAIIKNRNEANIGQVKLLRLIDSLSPALARRLMIAS